MIIVPTIETKNAGSDQTFVKTKKIWIFNNGVISAIWLPGGPLNVPNCQVIKSTFIVPLLSLEDVFSQEEVCGSGYCLPNPDTDPVSDFFRGKGSAGRGIIPAGSIQRIVTHDDNQTTELYLIKFVYVVELDQTLQCIKLSGKKNLCYVTCCMILHISPLALF